MMCERLCPKCGAESGDNWLQCEGECPMPGSPYHNYDHLYCTGCGTTEQVTMQPSRTMYHTELPADDPKNPNRPVALCPDCAREHHEYWDERWAEVYQGCL